MEDSDPELKEKSAVAFRARFYTVLMNDNTGYSLLLGITGLLFGKKIKTSNSLRQKVLYHLYLIYLAPEIKSHMIRATQILTNFKKSPLSQLIPHRHQFLLPIAQGHGF